MQVKSNNILNIDAKLDSIEKCMLNQLLLNPNGLVRADFEEMAIPRSKILKVIRILKIQKKLFLNYNVNEERLKFYHIQYLKQPMIDPDKMQLYQFFSKVFLNNRGITKHQVFLQANQFRYNPLKIEDCFCHLIKIQKIYVEKSEEKQYCSLIAELSPKDFCLNMPKINERHHFHITVIIDLPNLINSFTHKLNDNQTLCPFTENNMRYFYKNILAPFENAIQTLIIFTSNYEKYQDAINFFRKLKKKTRMKGKVSLRITNLIRYQNAQTTIYEDIDRYIQSYMCEPYHINSRSLILVSGDQHFVDNAEQLSKVRGKEVLIIAHERSLSCKYLHNSDFKTLIYSDVELEKIKEN